MDKQLFRTIFLPFYTKYLNDLEAEIRSIACVQLTTICEFLEPDDIVTKILPALRSLPQDSQAYVRRNSLFNSDALAKSLVLLCPLVGKKHTSEQILPKFLQLLKDEDSEVRLAVFQNVNEISKVLGIETLSQTTIPALQ
jgi:serine/threonine-protein phosphatase 2A regulatory subunit A